MPVTIATITPIVSSYGSVSSFALNEQGVISGAISGIDTVSGYLGQRLYFGVSYLYAINDAGEAAGLFYSSSGREAVLVQNGTVTDLPRFSSKINNGGVLSDGGAIAYGINNSDLIVGESYKADGTIEACLWQNGTIVDLGALPGAPSGGSGANATGVATVFASQARAVNDAGLVVGSSETGPHEHAVEWRNGLITDLGALDSGSDSEARAISNSGVIVGLNYFSDSSSHAVMWQNGVITDLGAATGYVNSAAYGINTQGFTVGFVADAAELQLHAALWENGIFFDLNTLLPANSGWVLESAKAINDQDQITGIGTYNGVEQTFILSLDGLPKVITTAAPGSANQVTTGNVAELYSAVLARVPDLAGLNYYQSYLKTHPAAPLQLFAEWFLSSSEYTGNAAHNYAASAAGDAQFIVDSYQNLLHRTPGSDEIAFYQSKVIAPMEAGLISGSQDFIQAQFHAHAQMLVYFSASNEFLADVQISAAHPADAQHWLFLQ